MAPFEDQGMAAFHSTIQNGRQQNSLFTDGKEDSSSAAKVLLLIDVDSLWPPNHRMQSIRVFIDATDACTDPADLDLVEVTLTSNEPDNLPGDEDGNTTGDTDGQDGFTAPVDVTQYFTFDPAKGRFEGLVFLRAERAENSFGRSYTIAATVMNSHNNWATSHTVVVVPNKPSF